MKMWVRWAMLSRVQGRITEQSPGHMGRVMVADVQASGDLKLSPYVTSERLAM